MMDKIIELMQNDWVIGIGGGIISGIIVYYITVYVLDRKKKHDIKRNILYANNAVLDILRPYIANSGLPDKKEIQAVINSVSRQYGVKSIEMNSISVFYEELLVEFISNPYIPGEAKKRNIENLLGNIDVLKSEEAIKSEQEQKERQTAKGKTVQVIGALVGILSTIFSIFTGAVLSGNGKGSFNSIVGVISAISVVIVVVLGIWSYLRIYKLQKMHINSSTKFRSYFVDRDYLRMQNSGTNIDDMFNESFSFVNYF